VETETDVAFEAKRAIALGARLENILASKKKGVA